MSSKKKKIYTYDETADIMRRFERLLYSHYNEIFDEVEDILRSLIEEVKENADNIEIIEGKFK